MQALLEIIFVFTIPFMFTYTHIHICMYTCMYVSMYACMYVYIQMILNILPLKQKLSKWIVFFNGENQNQQENICTWNQNELQYMLEKIKMNMFS